MPVFCYRNTQSGKGTPMSTRSTASMNEDEMLENELESIFSAGKVAMKSIFKEEDKEPEEKTSTLVNNIAKEVTFFMPISFFKSFILYYILIMKVGCNSINNLVLYREKMKQIATLTRKTKKKYRWSH